MAPRVPGKVGDGQLSAAESRANNNAGGGYPPMVNIRFYDVDDAFLYPLSAVE
ncbi:hypothetical protein SAMD00023353_2000800 [Rosellinia necatrix]|uniref:Uncharacterized protein n=1 Tax=Rosellinia necatrix TaxID=77044 RepID=A0A1S8A7M0_ROSNE|nr:hypothetical protein SAMD00023353_2000800 [Rosellinia necatrix]